MQVRAASGAVYLAHGPKAVHSGGQGEVWAGVAAADNEPVAIKIAHLSGSAVRALEAERVVLEALASRDHAEAHVVRLIDHGRTVEGRPFLVLEWFAMTVARWLEEGTPDLAARLRIAVVAGISVDWLHTHGGTSFELVIHHDVKLQNLLLDGRAGLERVVLGDFGTARTGRADLRVTIPAEVTPGAAAPEAFVRGAKRLLDPSIDVFSFAAAVFGLVTGRRLSSAQRDERAPAALLHTAAYDLVRLYDLRDLNSSCRERFDEARASFDIEAALKGHSIHTFGDADRDALIGAFLAFATTHGVDEQVARAAGLNLWSWLAACLSPLPEPRPKSVRPLLGALKSAGEALGVDVERSSEAAAGLLRPGDRVDRYVVQAKIGDGGMGEVYRVLDERLRVPWALKVVKVGGTAYRNRLIKEGSAQARLNHPGIVRCQAMVEVRGRPGLLLEYVDGGDLQRLLQKGDLPPRDLDRLAAEIMEAMAYAHGEGVVHRDLKPANVLLQRRSGVLCAKITDFGLVKETGGGVARLTLPGTAMGTPAYMAPEQAQDASAVGAVADVFSVGAILYEMVTGRPAFADQDLADVHARAHRSTYPPVRQIGPDAEARHVAAIDAALQARAADRPQSVAELLRVWRGEQAWVGVVASSETIAPFDGETAVVDSETSPRPRRRALWLTLTFVFAGSFLLVASITSALVVSTILLRPQQADPVLEENRAPPPVVAPDPIEAAPSAPVVAAPPPSGGEAEPVVRPTPSERRVDPPPAVAVPPAPGPDVPEPEIDRPPEPPLPVRIRVHKSLDDRGKPSVDTRVTVDGEQTEVYKPVFLRRTAGTFAVTRNGLTECSVSYGLVAVDEAWSVLVGGVRIDPEVGVCCSGGRVTSGACE